MGGALPDYAVSSACKSSVKPSYRENVPFTREGRRFDPCTARHLKRQMMTITSIPLRSLKSYGDWRDAPVGALLQLGALEHQRVCLRCQLPTGPCLLMLDGSNRGALLESGHGAALDVSGLAEIIVSRLAPKPFDGEKDDEAFGIVCELIPRSGRYFVRAYLESRTVAYVWLRDAANTVLGKVETDLQVHQALVIGEIETGEQR